MSAGDVYEVRKVTEGDTADLMRTYIVFEERADYVICDSIDEEHDEYHAYAYAPCEWGSSHDATFYSKR